MIYQIESRLYSSYQHMSNLNNKILNNFFFWGGDPKYMINFLLILS